MLETAVGYAHNTITIKRRRQEADIEDRISQIKCSRGDNLGRYGVRILGSSAAGAVIRIGAARMRSRSRSARIAG